MLHQIYAEPIQPLSWALAGTVLAENTLKYVLIAGGAWVIFYRSNWLRGAIKIDSRPPQRRDVSRELWTSLRSLLVFAAVGIATYSVSSHTRLYYDVDGRGWPWFFFSVAITIVVHDAYFYWTHRLMHHRWLFAGVHGEHHRSANPTPWAAYAFSVPEAVVQAGIFPVIAFTLPIHPLAFGLFMVWQVSFNVLGHCGFEVWPRLAQRPWWNSIMNTTSHHAMHHQVGGGNYSIYFNVWDRLCRTNRRDYLSFVAEVTRRPSRARTATGDRSANS